MLTMDVVRFDGKIALVTGAGRGIGRGITKALSAGGATVHAISIIKEELDSLVQEVPNICAHTLDISDWDKTKELVQSLGPIHLLVNNAGVLEMAPFLDTTKEQLFRLFSVNTEASFNISQVVAADMVQRGEGGHIVNISSVAGEKPYQSGSVYCMSKAALQMMTKCMALELGKHKIRVNAVLPGLVRTSMTEAAIKNKGLLEGFLSVSPIKKISEITDIVNATLFLLSDKSDMITGTMLPVDGGWLLG